MDQGEVLLKLEGISKYYGSFKANDQISLEIMPGEIHALLGENGAGKSTLVKMLYGSLQPDEGRIIWEGQEVHVPNPAAARDLGVGMVFQHFSLFETLSVVQNVSLMAKGTQAQLAQKIVTLGDQFGLTVDPDAMVHQLSVGERQRVEILKALYRDAKILILDEPNANLDNSGSLALNHAVRRMKEAGRAVLIMAHRPAAIQECDMLLVLDGGMRVAFGPKNEVLAGMVKNAGAIQQVPAQAGGLG